MRIRWTSAAAADLQHISEYLKAHDPQYRALGHELPEEVGGTETYLVSQISAGRNPFSAVAPFLYPSVGTRPGVRRSGRAPACQLVVVDPVGTSTFDALFGYCEDGELIYAALTRNGFTPALF